MDTFKKPMNPKSLWDGLAFETGRIEAALTNLEKARDNFLDPCNGIVRLFSAMEEFEEAVAEYLELTNLQ